MIRATETRTDSSVTVALARAAGEREDRGHEQADKGDDEQCGVGAGDLPAERLRAVAQPADQHAGPEHEQQVADDRAGERRLDDLDEAGLQREEGDDQLGDVAEGRVEDAADLRPGQRPEALRREADGPGQPEDPDGGDDEQRRCRLAPTTKSRTIATRLTATVPSRNDPRRCRERSEDGQAAGSGRGGHRRIVAIRATGRRSVGRCPVERAPRQAGRRRHASRGIRPRPGRPRRAARPPHGQRPSPPRCRVRRPAPRAPRPRTDDEHELTARRDGAAPGRLGELAERARGTTVSWSFVSSRHTAAGPIGAARRREVPRACAATRLGRLEHDRAPLVGGDAGEPLPPLAAGARQEPLERPVRAGDARHGHGREHGRRARASARPCRPPPAHAATSSSPGSLTTGVPASVTSARSAPARRCSSSAAARGPARSGRGSWSSASSISWRSSSRRVSRVSSAAISGTARSTSSARSVMSPRLPIGVATTYSVPPAGPPPAGVRRPSSPRRAGPPARVQVVDPGRPRPELRDRRDLPLELGRGDHPVDPLDGRARRSPAPPAPRSSAACRSARTGAGRASGS